jgi:hypothetical protein
LETVREQHCVTGTQSMCLIKSWGHIGMREGEDDRNSARTFGMRQSLHLLAGMLGASEVERARQSRDAVAFFGRRSSESDVLRCSPFPNCVEAAMMRLQKNST